MKTVFALVLIALLGSGCASTGNSLPTRDIGIEFFPASEKFAALKKADVITVVQNKSELPASAEYIGTMEIVKLLDSCETPQECDADPFSLHNSSEYISQYGKKAGASFGLIQQKDILSMRPNTVQSCAVYSEKCDQSKIRTEPKTVCTPVGDGQVCRTEQMPIELKSCKDRCAKYSTLTLPGFKKTQRTVVALYRNKD